jgi:drug/metabolite transporter (DMT)-like permease
MTRRRVTLQNALIVFWWMLLVLSIVLWPVSMFTFAKDEPPAVLSLSWFAITLTAATGLVAAYVKKDQ